MKYKCKFIISGISNIAAKRVIEIKVKDHRGIKGDTASITFDDRDYMLKIPSIGQKFEVHLGYEGSLVRMGAFEVNKIIIKESPKCTITAIGSSIFLKKSQLKNPTTKKFSEKTIGAILSYIAKKNGYSLKCDPSICSIYLDHIVQRKESDMSFITRLVDENDAYLKISNNEIRVFPKNKEMGRIIFNKTEVKSQISISGLVTNVPTSIEWVISERTNYTGVKVKFHDKDKNKSTNILVGSEKNVYEDSRVYESYVVAKRIAGSRLASLQRGTGILRSFTTPGDGNIIAGMTGVLVGFRPEIGPSFQIKEAIHTMNSGGYATTGNGDHG
jgi:phage protein D